MTGIIRLAALSGVALLAFAAVAAVIAALAHRRVETRLRVLSPSLRARLLLGWASAPAALAAALVAATLWPSLGVALGLAVDHCPAHDGHVHLCLHHLPLRGAGIAGALGLAALGTASVAVLGHGVRFATLAAALRRARSSEHAPGVGLVRSSRPFALSVGWFRPTVLLSSALVERFTPEQLAVVVAHERAHAARRDSLTTTFARVVTLAHLPRIRRRILAELTLACEQACDEVAARACGDRVLVAETIVRAERAAAAAAPFPAAGLAFGGGEVADRVESLLAAPVEVAAPRRLLWILLATFAVLAAAAPHVHHWTETFLDHLPH